MELTYDLFKQLEDLYLVKSWHLKYLDNALPEAWPTLVPGGYAGVWEQRGWKFNLADLKPLPKPLKLLIPDKRRLAIWTMIGYTNELLMEISPESLGDFLKRYIDNPAARKNLTELFLGLDDEGPGFKAFGSIVVCASEENRYIDRYLPLLRIFAESDPRVVGVDDELRESAVKYFSQIDDFRRYLDSDIFIFRRFSRDLESLFRKSINVGVLGYGEISSVLALERETGHPYFSGRELAYKKMPPFPDRESVESYERLFDSYHVLLEEIGLNPPRHGIRQISKEDGSFTVFVKQARLPSESIGSNVIRIVGTEDCRRLFRMVLDETYKVAEYNRKHPERMVGIDIQISNWGVVGFNPENPEIKGDERLFFIDTSTPMIREEGDELLDPELFLKSVPFFIRPIVRGLFLDEVLDRYYDTRSIIKDLIANFIKEGRPEVVPALVDEANDFFSSRMADSGFGEISEKEVKRYYRRDRLIWIAFQTARRIDRFIQKGILRRKYPYRLPDKIGLFAGKEISRDRGR